MVHSEIQKVRYMNRENLSRNREKYDKNDSLNLVLTHHPALNKANEIWKKARRHTIRSTRLNAVFPSPPRVAFRNPKTLKDHLVRPKLKIRDSNDEENGIYKCGNINCDICNVLYLSNEFQSAVTGMQYVGSTVTKFCLRLNRCKLNIKLYGEGKPEFKQEKLTEHFSCPNHNVTHKDISAQIIDHCIPNDQGR